MFPEVCRLFNMSLEELMAEIVEEAAQNKHRKLASSIVDIFEDLLEEHHVIIPDEDRPEDNDTPLYGCTYANLVDRIEEVLRNAEH